MAIKIIRFALTQVKVFGFVPAHFECTPRSQSVQWSVFWRFSLFGIFFLQIMQKSMSFAMSLSVGDGESALACKSSNTTCPMILSHAHLCTMAAHNEHNVMSCKITFVYRRLEV